MMHRHIERKPLTFSNVTGGTFGVAKEICDQQHIFSLRRFNVTTSLQTSHSKEEK